MNEDVNQELLKRLRSCLELELAENQERLLKFIIFCIEEGLDDYLTSHVLTIFKHGALWANNEENFLAFS